MPVDSRVVAVGLKAAAVVAVGLKAAVAAEEVVVSVVVAGCRDQRQVVHRLVEEVVVVVEFRDQRQAVRHLVAVEQAVVRAPT